LLLLLLLLLLLSVGGAALNTHARSLFSFFVIALRDVKFFVFLWFSAGLQPHLCGGERRATVKKKN
jgi:hypothetical protein